MAEAVLEANAITGCEPKFASRYINRDGRLQDCEVQISVGLKNARWWYRLVHPERPVVRAGICEFYGSALHSNVSAASAGSNPDGPLRRNFIEGEVV